MKRGDFRSPCLPALFIALLALGLTGTQALSEPIVPELTCPPCDDLNPCTDDSCNALTGTCEHRLNIAPGGRCNDNLECTWDGCNPATGACTHTPDDNRCPGSTCRFVCDGGPVGGCSYRPTPDCDHNPCTLDFCDNNYPGCHVFSFNTSPCNDNDICTVNDRCSSGSCHGTPLCDDGSVCTTDSCDPFTAGCTHTNNNSPCSDGDLCTAGDACSNGACQSGTLLNCDDGNACTLDSCTGTGCTHGSVSCNDGNPCTTDSCDPPTGGCIHTNNTDPCSDGILCTVEDVCSNGACHGTTLDCNDGNACTADICTGSNCTYFDTTASCNDGNPCTTDACNPATGCVHQPITSEITCGMGACQRTVDTCAGGVPQSCVPGTPTDEVCNGLDDDCDGLVDENRVQADCIISPSTLNLDSQGGMVALTCKLWDVCNPLNPVSIPGSTVSQVYVSRADSVDNTNDDVTLPDPSTLPCPDPDEGFLYERGISENLVARDISNANVTFKFDQPSDGDCATLDGDRADLAARLAAIPDNTNATVCISGTAGGADFQACMLLMVRNK